MVDSPRPPRAVVGAREQPSQPSRRLRSAEWFSGLTKSGFAARTMLKKEGVPQALLDGRPVIGICNTWSELNPCNSILRVLADRVKAGVSAAGGLPLEFPAMSLGETFLRPTAMMFRNLAAMEIEESIRGNPVDGVVLLGGCDKTTPALLLGAASCDLPSIVLSAGPMLNGKWRGRDIGSGTVVFELYDQLRAGNIDAEAFLSAEGCMSRSAGTCMTMGTASTMACLVEAMGLSLPGNGTIPAPDSRRLELAYQTGQRAVALVQENVSFSRIVTAASLDNAVRVCSALGGSTNAVVHLVALARRLQIGLDLARWDYVSREVPCLLNLMPTGRYLMEDFHYAGGLPALMKEIRAALDLTVPTVSGSALGEQVRVAVKYGEDVIRSVDAPISTMPAIAVVRGNLAPDGAVMKPSAATPWLLEHSGRAVVFESIEDYNARIDAEDLDVRADDVLVLKNCGPKGYPGFPEVGNMSLPRKLVQQGIKDMVRISDARMSGTAYGTVVLHVAPEAAAGGPLALVRSGDIIDLSVARRSLDVRLADAELAHRRSAWKSPATPYTSGYGRLFVEHVLQANEGCDFDFLLGRRDSKVAKPYL